MCPVLWGGVKGLSGHPGEKQITPAALFGFYSGLLTDRGHLSSVLRAKTPQLLVGFVVLFLFVDLEQLIDHFEAPDLWVPAW